MVVHDDPLFLLHLAMSLLFYVASFSKENRRELRIITERLKEDRSY